MRIEYDSNKLEKLFNDWNVMSKRVGPNLTKGIKKKYEALKAADNLYIFFQTKAGVPERLEGDLIGFCSVHIDAHNRLIFRPKGKDMSPEAFKQYDTIIIKGVDDYHGGKNNWLIP